MDGEAIMETKYLVAMLIAAGMLMYIGTTMFYNTGFGITDFNLEDTSDTQYQLSYMLRSVRSFDYVDCEYTVLSEDGQVIATGNTILNDIADGSFQINETLNKTKPDLKAKGVEIRIYEEPFNPELKNDDGSYAQEEFFIQRFVID